jgi:hypothetical protein
MAEEELKKGQACIVYFIGVVEYSFKLWTHLQNALEVHAIDDHI